jgi:hypothetical protein
MSARVEHPGLAPLSALELLTRWAAIHGPDPRTERRDRRRGTLGLCRLPTYRRQDEAGRRTAPSARSAERADGRPRDVAGVMSAWAANAPPALPSA